MNHFLVVDLDGTLIATDCLKEQWLKLLFTKPKLWFLSFVWLMKGRLHFKNQLAKILALDPNALPYNNQVLTLISNFKKTPHHKVILASASPQPWVEAVAKQVACFDYVLASDQQTNLKGLEKLKLIKGITESEDFEYIGDSRADIPIWSEARHAHLVDPSWHLRNSASRVQPNLTTYHTKPKMWRSILRLIRIHQWAKNILLFIPIITGHQIFDWQKLSHGVVGFFAFSFIASSVYIMNDLSDLEADRRHQRKKGRPLASGAISIEAGVAIFLFLVLVAIGLGSLLGTAFVAILAGYFALNILYSFALKAYPLIDLFILSIFYTLRIFAGSLATDIAVSEWLLNFSLLFFFNLACVKRFAEVSLLGPNESVLRRGYKGADAQLIQNLGVGTGLLSVLVILLYLQSPTVRSLYSYPINLIYLSPIILFWIVYVWFKTSRGLMSEDPVIFALKDRVSWGLLGIAALTIGLSV